VKDILDLIKNKKNIGENWVKKNYPDFHLFVFNLFNDDIPWIAKFFLHKNDIKQIPKCYCGNLTKYKSGVYGTFCSKKCATNSIETRNKILKTNIEKYGVDMPLKNKDIKEKVISKWIDSYGVDNPSKSNKIKNKVKNTNISKFGVEYVSQLKEVKDKLSFHMKKNRKGMETKKRVNIAKNVIDKIKNLNIEFIQIKGQSIYEMTCLNCNSNFLIHKNNLNDRLNYNNTVCTNCNPIDNLDSDGERQVFNFINENYTGEIIRNFRISRKELDIYLPELKIGFEFNGIHWHSELYKENSYHYNKTNFFKDNGIRIIHIWEDDWTYRKNIVMSKILNILNKSERIGARKCQIKEITDNEIVKQFLDTNHIQGDVTSKVRIGLYYNDELVSLMTFGNLRKNLGQNTSEGSWELLRFTNKLNTSVIGGASKLFNFFIKRYSPLEVISYADRDWSNGNLYYNLGFEQAGITKPNYYYVVKNMRKNRFSFRKDILVKKGYDSTKTEKQIMFDLGYYRIYNSGNIKYIKKIK
jgi:very-short-patch-repair endonuclease